MLEKKAINSEKLRTVCKSWASKRDQPYLFRISHRIQFPTMNYLFKAGRHSFSQATISFTTRKRRSKGTWERTDTTGRAHLPRMQRMHSVPLFCALQRAPLLGSDPVFMSLNSLPDSIWNLSNSLTSHTSISKDSSPHNNEYVFANASRKSSSSSHANDRNGNNCMRLPRS